MTPIKEGLDETEDRVEECEKHGRQSWRVDQPHPTVPPTNCTYSRSPALTSSPLPDRGYAARAFPYSNFIMTCSQQLSPSPFSAAIIGATVCR